MGPRPQEDRRAGVLVQRDGALSVYIGPQVGRKTRFLESSEEDNPGRDQGVQFR